MCCCPPTEYLACLYSFCLSLPAACLLEPGHFYRSVDIPSHSNAVSVACTALLFLQDTVMPSAVEFLSNTLSVRLPLTEPILFNRYDMLKTYKTQHICTYQMYMCGVLCPAEIAQVVGYTMLLLGQKGLVSSPASQPPPVWLLTSLKTI